jgi:hypothetical protein
LCMPRVLLALLWWTIVRAIQCWFRCLLATIKG